MADSRRLKTLLIGRDSVGRSWMRLSKYLNNVQKGLLSEYLCIWAISAMRSVYGDEMRLCQWPGENIEPITSYTWLPIRS
jgi:hypothetical protein